MKMNYYRAHTKSGSIAGSVYVIGGIITIMLILGLVTPVLTPVKSRLLEVASSFWIASNAFEDFVQNIPYIFKDKGMLLAENQYLKEERVFVDAYLARITALESENLELQTLLGRTNRGKTVVSASILVRPNKSPYDTIIIDVGKVDNVLPGDLVITSGNILLGEVLEVFKNNSLVSLYSNPDSETDVLLTSDNLSARAIGRGGGNFYIELPRDLSVSTSVPITAAHAPEYILGIVGEIKFEPADVLQTILFKTPVNILHVKWVDIIRR
jgi:cell shape-determining protein MreC